MSVKLTVRNVTLLTVWMKLLTVNIRLLTVSLMFLTVNIELLTVSFTLLTVSMTFLTESFVLLTVSMKLLTVNFKLLTVSLTVLTVNVTLLTVLMPKMSDWWTGQWLKLDMRVKNRPSWGQSRPRRPAGEFTAEARPRPWRTHNICWATMSDGSFSRGSRLSRLETG